PANSSTPIVVPPGHPKFTADGSPSARPIRKPGQDPTADKVDTRGDLLTFDWTAQVKTDAPSSECFQVAFLQPVTKTQVFSHYSSGANDPSPGLCMPFLSRIPIRDGFAVTSPVWFIAGNSKGVGFNVIGTCQPNIKNVPFTVPPTAQTGVSMVDKPGGPFDIH